MKIVVRTVSLLRAWARKLGPYVMLEILLPGGTLFALLLLLYQRRSRVDAFGARRSAMPAVRA